MSFYLLVFCNKGFLKIQNSLSFPLSLNQRASPSVFPSLSSSLSLTFSFSLDVTHLLTECRWLIPGLDTLSNLRRMEAKKPPKAQNNVYIHSSLFFFHTPSHTLISSLSLSLSLSFSLSRCLSPRLRNCALNVISRLWLHGGNSPEGRASYTMGTLPRLSVFL